MLKFFFKTAFYWTSKLKSNSFLFKMDFYYNIKMNKFEIMSVILLHNFAKRGVIVCVKVKELKH